MLKKFLLALALCVSSTAFAVTHIKTDTGVILDFQDNEEEFVAHLINEAVDLYSKKQTINLEIRELLYNNEVIMTIGDPNARFTVQSNLDILENKPSNILFGFEIRF